MAKIEVVYGVWGFGATEDSEGTVLDGGTHDDFEVTAENAPYLAAGESAGVVRILDASDDERGLLEGHVQTQADGEAAYVAAQESGAWREGQLRSFVHDTEHRLSLPDEEANLTVGDRAWLTGGLADAYDELGEADKAKAVRAKLAAEDGEEG